MERVIANASDKLLPQKGNKGKTIKFHIRYAAAIFVEDVKLLLYFYVAFYEKSYRIFFFASYSITDLVKLSIC